MTLLVQSSKTQKYLNLEKAWAWVKCGWYNQKCYFGRNCPHMTTVFHETPYYIFIKMQSTFRRKKLHRTNQGSNLLGGSFSNRGNVRVTIQLRR